MKKSKKIMFALLVSVFSILIGLVFAVFAQEESPQLPHLFYGDSKINGKTSPITSVII